MLQRFQNWIKHCNLFIDKIDQDDDITDVATINYRRKQQLYATRLYIVLFIGNIVYVMILDVSVHLGSFLFSSLLPTGV